MTKFMDKLTSHASYAMIFVAISWILVKVVAS